MIDALSKLIDHLSNFFARRKGVLPLTGIAFVALNFILRLVAPGLLAGTEPFLHLGIILAIFGLMLYWAL